MAPWQGGDEGGAVVDRTAEFFSAVSAQVQAGRAAELSGKISLTSKKLQHLAQLTRRQGTFDDPMDEINVLSARLKEDTKFIKYELDQLQAYLDRNRQKVGRGSDNAAEHSMAIVQTMKMQLGNTAKSFKNVLEERQSTMRKKSDRRGLFGTKRAPLSGLGQGASAGGQQQGQQNQQASSQGSSLPRPSGVSVVSQNGGLHQRTSFQQQQFLSEGGDDEEEIVFDEAPLIQQTATVQDNAYLSSRVQAMNSIERHISELGEVFHQLAHMVADSRISIERIDDNVTAAQENMQQGYEQLVRTWMGVSNNRWLAAKILFVLLFFITFFVVFLA
ncbi:Syntaxin-5 [Hondaea fermentalgiana]|uniref:Syntaxin-5 n=1 Tax=Hondaea fermentalgiana TaxID=2315210 RepID=A0A2R5G8L7_9STRA|nr:Syntaxin-5 [Hondaea fermentalgiana]|eukprot:GBG26885.1 Syntaxin-5 [Hondaea fermentalgiana]